MNHLLLYSKLSSLPDNLKHEVSDFIDFLMSKKNKPNGNKPKAKFGSAKGIFIIKPGFDEPLDDFKDYMH